MHDTIGGDMPPTTHLPGRTLNLGNIIEKPNFKMNEREEGGPKETSTSVGFVLQIQGIIFLIWPAKGAKALAVGKGKTKIPMVRTIALNLVILKNISFNLL